MPFRTRASELLAKMGLDERSARHDLYEAQIELSSPVSPERRRSAWSLGGLRRGARRDGSEPRSAPASTRRRFGDVQHRATPSATCARARDLRGLVRRTPDCALHVHVGMPDAETAIRVCNGLRE